MQKDIKSIADKLLKQLYGQDALFREGQYEAIEASLTKKRTLVVQKTGWGKSLVYFMTTKILRDRGEGFTIVISPLLALMDNQKEAAEKLGLKCKTLDSRVKKIKDKELIIQQMKDGELDLVFTTPETLLDELFSKALPDIRIGLFVVDEAHCISDWGHDFRLNYGKLYKIINNLSSNVPVIATTATANNRVVEDLKQQLGDDVFVSRGNILRDNLYIQVLNMPSDVHRYAWILENINKLPGSGIIYCITKQDCERLSKFLIKNGIKAMSYYSGDNKNEENTIAEKLFFNNEIKVLVATIKLGMGYDKGDIGFVIHYQMPSNVVSYYQQIGRAGRNIDRAYTFLMMGEEDTAIQNYFINTAFPTEKEMEAVLNCISSGNGLNKTEILKNVNMRKQRIENALGFLKNDGYIYLAEDKKYYRNNKKYFYNKDYYDAITAIRRKEQEQMLGFGKIRKCYNKAIIEALDSYEEGNCGVCCNCLGHEEFSANVDHKVVEKAQTFLNNSKLYIEPRKKWPNKEFTGSGEIAKINEPGICLAKYGQPRYGKMVKEDKYSDAKRFRDELVEKSAAVLLEAIKNNNITGLAAVPSLRSSIVADFAQRLAVKCGLQYFDVLGKKKAEQQKNMENSAFQCENAYKSFFYNSEQPISGNILLVDDVVDSRWTLTVCGDILMHNAANKVYPFALADSSHGSDM